MSRTTLNVCGGLPMVISEKSNPISQETVCHGFRFGLHCAFKKLLTGTRWPPSLMDDDSWKTASTCVCGRMPMYFWPRFLTWVSTLANSYSAISQRRSSNTACSNLDEEELTSCSARGIFWSFILWTPADAEPSSIAAVKRAPFMIATRSCIGSYGLVQVTIRSKYVVRRTVRCSIIVLMMY